MRSADLLADGLSRVREVVHEVVAGLGPEELGFRPGPSANSIAWLIWHLTRVQDDHVSDVAGTEQVWTAGGWAERFGLPFGAAETGYGHSSHEVEQVQVASACAADRLPRRRLRGLGALCRHGDRRGPGPDRRRALGPACLARRPLVSVIDDDAQHAGQAAYLRGLLSGD